MPTPGNDVRSKRVNFEQLKNLSLFSLWHLLTPDICPESTGVKLAFLEQISAQWESVSWEDKPKIESQAANDREPLPQPHRMP
jgi:hypothetical protein